MSKNIIICSDGTGNASIKDRGTNVFKIYEALDLHHPATLQIAIYDDGVGTETFRPLQLLGGAFGFGLWRNIRQLYTGLVQVYEPGDRIYLFGFSRGAFTVRQLAGLILKIGIISRQRYTSTRELNKLVRQAQREYWQDNRAWLEWLVMKVFSWFRPCEGVAEFRSRYAARVPDRDSDHQHQADIRFIGVWDTVSAVGFPVLYVADMFNTAIYRFKFPDYKLGKPVSAAAHALSIDDQRATFHPLLWNESDEVRDKPRIDQTWFSGVHANIGGGYPKQGVSLVTLDWMMRKAEAAGVRFDQAAGIKFLDKDKVFYREHMNVNDKVYDSRSGLSAYYRYKPRDLFRKCRQNAFEPRIHATVINRIHQGTDGYAPGNIPREFTLVDGDSIGCRFEDASCTVTTALQDDTSLLDRTRGLILTRKAGGLILISSTLVFVAYLVPADLFGHGLQNFFVSLYHMITDIVLLRQSADTGELLQALKSIPLWVYLVPVGAYLLSRLSRGSMQKIFSEFWCALRQEPDRPGGQ